MKKRKEEDEACKSFIDLVCVNFEIGKNKMARHQIRIRDDTLVPQYDTCLTEPLA